MRDQLTVQQVVDLDEAVLHVGEGRVLQRRARGTGDEQARCVRRGRPRPVCRDADRCRPRAARLPVRSGQVDLVSAASHRGASPLAERAGVAERHGGLGLANGGAAEQVVPFRQGPGRDRSVRKRVGAAPYPHPPDLTGSPRRSHGRGSRAPRPRVAGTRRARRRSPRESHPRGGAWSCGSARCESTARRRPVESRADPPARSTQSDACTAADLISLFLNMSASA